MRANTATVTKDWKTADYSAADKFFCQNDLKYLCRDILGFQDWDECHDDLAEFLENSKKRFKLILIPREHLKTSVVTIGKAIQHILENPNVSILYSSAILGNSESFLSETREYLTRRSALPSVYGNFVSEVWNTERIVVAQRTTADKAPTIACAGADTAVVSQHYDVIFADDLVNRQTINTPDQILKTRKFYSDLFDLLKKPNGILYIIGTRWDDKDLYGQIITQEKELEEAGKPTTFDIHIRKAVEDGKIIYPKKFSPEILDDLLAKKGSYEFSCQYMNEPVNRDNQHFKPPVRYWEKLPAVAINLMTVDLATDSEDSDFNVVTNIAFSKENQMFVTECRRGHFNPTQMIDHIFEMVNKWNPSTVGIESIAYQRVFLYMLDLEMKKRNKFFSVTPIVPHKDKFTRLLALQPLWERGDILLKPGTAELADEFMRFPRGLNDDFMDTCEMALHLINGNISEIEQKKDYDALKEKDTGAYREWKNVDEKVFGRKKSRSDSATLSGIGS